MKYLAVAFRGNISARVLERINFDGLEKHYLSSGRVAIESYVSKLELDRYNLILGMGLYTGRDQEKIRIELSTNSRFRNDISELEVLLIPYNFQSQGLFKLADGIGNSYCNRLSYFMTSRIETLDKKIPYTFLHIPRKVDPEQAAMEIERQLSTSSTRA